MFCEQLNYKFLFRWFLDMNWDEPSFEHLTFTHNRMRLLEHDVAGGFFRTVIGGGQVEADQRRALYGRWDADRGLGIAQELASRG
jgi:transposase-like protein DUF772